MRDWFGFQHLPKKYQKPVSNSVVFCSGSVSHPRLSRARRTWWAKIFLRKKKSRLLQNSTFTRILILATSYWFIFFLFFVLLHSFIKEVHCELGGGRVHDCNVCRRNNKTPTLWPINYRKRTRLSPALGSFVMQKIGIYFYCTQEAMNSPGRSRPITCKHNKKKKAAILNSLTNTKLSNAVTLCILGTLWA